MVKKKIGKFLTVKEIPQGISNPILAYQLFNKNGADLGYIEWFPRWRCYIFAPTSLHSAFDATCLIDIANFCEKITKVAQAARGKK